MLDTHSYTEALAGVQEPAACGIPYLSKQVSYCFKYGSLSLARFIYNSQVDRQAVMLEVCP